MSTERAGFTPGPWFPCYHLRSAENDAACSCGYRGGIWGGDGERLVCEMGSTQIPGEEALSPARYDRPTELANARLIAGAPDMFETLEAPDAYMLASGYSGSDDEALHPEAAANWKRIRAALSRAGGSHGL